MATLIQAVSLYGPRVELSHTVKTREIAEYISARTSLNRGEVENVLTELNEAVIFFTRQGSPVKLARVGTFMPSISLEGILDVGFRLDTSIDGRLNAATEFIGNVKNRENIGKTSAELKALWNEEHPTDPIA